MTTTPRKQSQWNCELRTAAAGSIPPAAKDFSKSYSFFSFPLFSSFHITPSLAIPYIESPLFHIWNWVKLQTRQNRDDCYRLLDSIYGIKMETRIKWDDKVESGAEELRPSIARFHIWNNSPGIQVRIATLSFRIGDKPKHERIATSHPGSRKWFKAARTSFRAKFIYSFHLCYRFLKTGKLVVKPFIYAPNRPSADAKPPFNFFV